MTGRLSIQIVAVLLALCACGTTGVATPNDLAETLLDGLRSGEFERWRPALATEGDITEVREKAGKPLSKARLAEAVGRVDTEAKASFEAIRKDAAAMKVDWSKVTILELESRVKVLKQVPAYKIKVSLSYGGNRRTLKTGAARTSRGLVVTNPPTLMRNVKAEFKAFVTQVCACKDMTCVKRVQKALGERFKDVKPTAEETKAITPHVRKMQQCLMKLTPQS